MYIINSHYSALKGFINCKQTLICTLIYTIYNLFVSFFLKNCKIKGCYADFSTAGSLHHGFFKSTANCHYFTGCLHLSSKLACSVNELIKRELWHLNYYIIKNRFKTCCSFLCNKVWNFVQVVTDCKGSDIDCHRVTCCL